MPIKPENKNRYPSDWKQIRSRILERAAHKCEFCGIENYSMTSVRRPDKPFGTKVVLTIAHLHPPIENCADDNLKALCQKCHLNYDKELHKENRRETLEKKRGPILWPLS